MAIVPASYLCISTGNGGSFTVLWDVGAYWLDRHWSAHLYYRDSDVAVGSGKVAFVDCY